jgi:tartrate dehydratase beta subunit/fumarate hydratase class I family protein
MHTHAYTTELQSVDDSMSIVGSGADDDQMSMLQQQQQHQYMKQHPGYAVLVKEAIQYMKDPKGSSLYGITKTIEQGEWAHALTTSKLK